MHIYELLVQALHHYGPILVSKKEPNYFNKQMKNYHAH